MSDDNSKGSASSAEQMVPKSRLDELIAQKNQAAQQTHFLQQTLSSLMAQQRAQRAPDPEDQEIERLKDENPVAHKLLLKQKTLEQDLKQTRAGFSSLADEIDRKNFFEAAGKESAKYAEKVEQVIQAERQKGNFNVDRRGVYVFLKGQEQIARESAPQASAPAPSAPAESHEDVPSSDHRFASTLKGSAAPTVAVEKTREERIKELENVEF